MTQTNFAIQGMSCSHCVAAVERALATVPGVQVDNVAIGKATVTYAPDKTSTATITDAINDAGYEAHETP
jgi:copper chaperone